MQGIKKALVTAVAVVAMMMCALSLANAQDEQVGQISQPLSPGGDPQLAPPGCPGAAANGLTKGWLIKMVNKCPKATVMVAVSYRVNGEWRDVGYWTLPPGGMAPVALTDNRYFYYYAHSIKNDWYWRGEYCYNPCGKASVCGQQVYIKMRQYGNYEFPLNC